MSQETRSKTKKMHNFKELKIWQLSRKFVKKIYLLTRSFPEAERYGLISQMQRTAVSIPSNIAEGSGRTNKEFIHFLSISLSSAFELETQLYLSSDIEYCNENEISDLLDSIQEIQKMIYKFRQKLES
jgi:four helix bundle protein